MSTSAVASVPVASAAVTPAAVVTSGPMPYKKAVITVLGFPITQTELILAGAVLVVLVYAHSHHMWMFKPRMVHAAVPVY